VIIYFITSNKKQDFVQKPNRLGYCLSMPTIIRIGRLRVTIYPNDHRPAHVHVIGNGCEAVFNLSCPDGPVALRETYGFAQHELNVLADALTEKLADLCSKWREIHGRYL
jgi:hypothetical protein